MVPLYLEEKLIGGVFDVVLGFSVSHAVCGHSLDGQNDVSRTQVDPRCFTARSHLRNKDYSLFWCACFDILLTVGNFTTACRLVVSC